MLCGLSEANPQFTRYRKELFMHEAPVLMAPLPVMVTTAI